MVCDSDPAAPVPANVDIEPALRGSEGSSIDENNALAQFASASQSEHVCVNCA